MFKKSLMAACCMLALTLWAAPAAADVIIFDMDGSTGALAPQQVTSLDWNVGNAIAVSTGVPVTALSPPGTTFQLYYQANLSLANVVGGSTVTNNTSPTPGALDSITVVIGFQETIATNVGGNITFAFAPGGNNFFQIYANTVPGDNLTGVCFICGTQIMAGVVTPINYTSNFIANLTTLGPLDQFNNGLEVGDGDADSYDNGGATLVNSVFGSGSVNLTGQVTSGPNSWFLGGLNGSLITFAFANSTTKLPYQEADPSACFLSVTQSGTLLNPTCTGGLGQRGVATVGSVNGLSGPNVMFQADANTSFITTPAAVPEPATLTLLGIGLLGSAAARRRQKKAKK